MTRSLIVDGLPWIMSAGTIGATWAIGRRRWWCWYLAFGTQMLWFVWIFTSGAWGFLPTAVVLSTIHVRNQILWSRESAFAN